MENNDKLLISKIMDKIKRSKTKNQITNSKFLNEHQIMIIEKELQKNNQTNYFFEGGYDAAESKVFISYPTKLDKNIAQNQSKSILKGIKIELPNEIRGKLKHKDYLGTVMSFGLERDRIGDIIVYDNLAYIIVLQENAEYIKSSFEFEKRLKKANISIIDINNIQTKEIQFENIFISVNSMRLDSVISEILHTSRKIAQELLKNEKVSINYLMEEKQSKVVKEKDILIIKGKGKYIIYEFMGKNKKEKEIILVKKYI